MSDAIKEIVEQSDRIFLEYKKALAAFGAEPEPLPRDPEGGASGLLNWILNEFFSLQDIFQMVSDNSAVISFESILVVLDREGCEGLDRLASADFVSPTYSELSPNIANVQAVKKNFVRRFWKVAGREIVRGVAQGRLEAVKFRFFFANLKSSCLTC